MSIRKDPRSEETGAARLDETVPVRARAGGEGALGREPLDPLPVGSLINGRYRIDAFIGAGGMGTVYKVTDALVPDRRLALKTIRRDVIRQDDVDLFKSEFKTMTGFHHPNLASVYDFEPMHGTATYLFTMEFVDGRDAFRATEGADTESVVDLFVQMCRALAYVHSRELIHFDLKPSNVLVSNLGRVKVLDFGVAVTARQGARPRFCTPAYTAPELLHGGNVDHRADLYSLGVMLYQLLTRRQAMDAGVNLDDPAAQSLPLWLRDLIRRLCATQPADRFRSANAVVEAVNRGGGRAYEFETPQTRESYILSSRFIGRERELRQVMEAVDDRARGSAASAPMVFVSGASGVGKSRLMREVRHRAQLSGFAFVEADCYEGSLAEYGPVAHAVGHLMRLSDALDEGALVCTAPLEFQGAEARPMAATETRAVDVDPRREQVRLREQTAEFLIDVARHVPYVLYVNDLQWVKPGAAGILAHLARRLSTADATGAPVRLTVLGTFRDEEVAGQPFETLLRELKECRAVTTVPLAPLNADEVTGLVGSMVGADPPGPFIQRLARETAGVPFFVEEVMRTLVENGSVYFEHGTWAAADDIKDLPISTNIVSVLRRRADVLDAGARALLTAVAAYGRPAPHGVLAAAIALDPADFASALRLLLQRQIVMRVSADPVMYAVAHDRMREVVDGGLSAENRSRVHESLAGAIEHVWPEQLDDHVYELARHYWLARNREKAFAYSLRGAEHARATYANDVAIELYSRALELPDGQDPALRRDVNEKLGDLYTLNGRFEDAFARYREVMAAIDVKPDQARLFRKIANVHWQKGELGASVDWLWRAAEALGDVRPKAKLMQVAATAEAVARHVVHRLWPPRAGSDDTERTRLLELAATYLQLGEAYFFHDSSQMLLPILRASNAGERAGRDSSALCRAYHAIVVLYGTLTVWPSAQSYARRLSAMAERLNSPWHIGAAHTYWLILHYYRSEWQQGIDRGRQGKEMLSRCGDVMELSFAYWVTALCHYYRGELPEAAAWGSEGLKTMQRADSEQPAKGILAVCGRVNARLGRAAEARHQIERSISLATEARDLFLLTWAQMMMGDCLLVAGEVEEAVVWLESARRQRETNGLLPEFLIEIYPLLAAARLEQLERQTHLSLWERRRRLGEISAIARKAVRLSKRRRHFHSPALRAAALCRWRQGRPRKATKLFERSVAVAEQLGAPLQLGEAHETWGRCLADAGRTSEGRDHLERAHQLFERAGAVPFVTRVRASLERC